MASGVKLDDKVKEKFIDVKSRHEYDTVLLRINDKYDAVEEVATFKKQKFSELCDCIEKDYPDQPLFVLHDYHNSSDDDSSPEDDHHDHSHCQCKKSKLKKSKCLCYFTWCSDTAKIKKKMVMAATAGEVKKSADGFKLQTQATDMDELRAIRKAALDKSKV